MKVLSAGHCPGRRRNGEWVGLGGDALGQWQMPGQANFKIEIKDLDYGMGAGLGHSQSNAPNSAQTVTSWRDDCALAAQDQYYCGNK